MKDLFGLFILCLIMISCQAQKKKIRTISKNKMTAQWHYTKDRIHFEMSAPTTGWLTIGLNTNSSLVGSSLLMGNVINGKTSVVEHYTIDLGDYKPIEELGVIPKVQDITGYEMNGITRIKFSLPIAAKSEYQKDLRSSLKYNLILAYSREDDFQHHSIMRTSMNVKL